ncbi:MAG: PEP-CTERM sorting domain-containing protein [Pirellulales bacterium]|nr:PEP-CTERM sorting domain-containing protein [Pirellulales bacterium]
MNLLQKTLLGICVYWLVAFSGVSQASAGLIINFSTDGGSNFADEFDVNVGQSQTIGVYLSDTVPGGVLETDGLFSLALDANAPTADFGKITAANVDTAAFDFALIDTFTDTSLTWDALNLFNPISTGQSILLGQFTFEATQLGTTSFAFADRQPGGDSTVAGWLDGQSQELDQQIFGPSAAQTFSLTINSVPEPSSMAILATASLAMSLAGRRRRTSRKSLILPSGGT